MRPIWLREGAAPDDHLKHDIMMVMRFIFLHSHAFDGGKLTIEDGRTSGSSCLIEFADGTTVIGQLVGARDDDYKIKVPAYKAAKGNVVKTPTRHIIKRTAGSV